MKVHVLMPVSNGLALPTPMLECLRADEVDDTLSIVVAGDGFTDEAVQFLGSELSEAGVTCFRWLSYRLAGSELALSVRSAGWKTLVCASAVVLSRDKYGSVFRTSSGR